MVFRSARTARILWIVFAFVAWNVVFDRILVLEGRRYVYAAGAAERESRPYVRVEPWMQAARARALWDATAVGGGILVVGLGAVAFAERSRAESLKAEGRSPKPDAWSRKPDVCLSFIR